MNKSIAVVTGASQGIGRATATRLARDFSVVVVAARNRAALTEVAAQVESAGEMTDEQWQGGAELKLHGARRLTIRAWDALKASQGSVVFMSGNAALHPNPTFAAVATINAAIIALAKAFAEQGIKDGVQVNSIVPARL